jgi:hypothetical protein
MLLDVPYTLCGSDVVLSLSARWLGASFLCMHLIFDWTNSMSLGIHWERFTWDFTDFFPSDSLHINLRYLK